MRQHSWSGLPMILAYSKFEKSAPARRTSSVQARYRSRSVSTSVPSRSKRAASNGIVVEVKELSFPFHHKKKNRRPQGRRQIRFLAPPDAPHQADAAKCGRRPSSGKSGLGGER